MEIQINLSTRFEEFVMNDTERAVIDILKSYLNNTSYSLPVDLDSKSLLNLINIHNLQGIAYVVLKNNDNILSENLKQSFYMLSTRSIVMDLETKKVMDVFNKNSIKHVPVKGYAIKKCYRDPELRTMGDVDILIKDEDRSKSDLLLKEMGYKIDNFSSFKHVWNYSNNKLYLEVHTRLIHEKLFNNFDYSSYFADAINYTRQIENYTYELNPEYHLLFLLMHMAKHFFGEGCGIRMIFDIPVYINYYRDEINWKFVLKELERIKLLRFADTIFGLCSIWFGLDIPYDIPALCNNTYYKLSNYIFEGGVFGFENRNQGAVKLRREVKTGEKGFKKKIHQIHGVIKWICPSYENMQQRAIWFNDKPKILLPVAWFSRWIMAIKIRKKNIFKKLISILRGEQEAIYQQEILTDLGLYED